MYEEAMKRVSDMEKPVVLVSPTKVAENEYQTFLKLKELIVRSTILGIESFKLIEKNDI
jgi:hypothetical protein